VDNNLSKEEVKKLMSAYADTAVTDELYQFGTTMLSEVQQRVARLDSKLGTMFGWATGLLAFVFVEINKSTDSVSHYCTLGSAVFALLTVVFAFRGLQTRGDWKSPSDKSWFGESHLANEDGLKRYHIRVMHETRLARLQITQIKSVRLHWGEIWLMIAAVLLFVGISFQFTCEGLSTLVLHEVNLNKYRHLAEAQVVVAAPPAVENYPSHRRP